MEFFNRLCVNAGSPSRQLGHPAHLGHLERSLKQLFLAVVMVRESIPESCSMTSRLSVLSVTNDVTLRNVQLRYAW